VCAAVAATILLWKPWGMGQLRRTAREVIERNILGDLKPGSLRADLPGVVFYAEGVAPGPRWRGVVLVDERDPARTQVLTAPAAQATLEAGVGIALENGVLTQRAATADELTLTTFERGTLLFNVADALNRRDTFRFGHEELSPFDLLERARAAEAAGESGVGFRAAFHHRVSQLFAPLALALVAAAVAQGGRRRAARTAALIAFGLYLAFYVVSRVGVQLGEKAVLAPALAGHLPVIVTFAVGVVMLAWISARGVR
jgi:lipopolysaccharide export LptBFGC system permease protein LptF